MIDDSLCARVFSTTVPVRNITDTECPLEGLPRVITDSDRWCERVKGISVVITP